MSILDEIQALKDEIDREWAKVSSLDVLESFRIKYLGKKGVIQEFIKKLSTLAPEDRRTVGKLVNEIKEKYERLVKEKKEEFASTFGRQWDLCLPPRQTEIGNLHPLTKVIEELLEVMAGLGFEEGRG